MKRAMVRNADGHVMEVVPQGGDFAVTNEYTWVDCPDDVADDYTWNGSTFTPPPGPSLESLKAAKHAEIERDRDAAVVANVTYDGHQFQADARSQQMLASTILLAQAGVYTPTVWRSAANVDVTVALMDLVSIAGLIAGQTQAAYAASWARKAALVAATTPAEVEAV